MKNHYILTLLLIFPLTIASQNLVLNGGCENPGTGETNNPDSWTNQYGNGIQCFLNGAFGAIVNEGSYAFVKNSFNAGNHSLSQVINLTADESGSVFDYSIDYNTFEATTHQFTLTIEALSAADANLGHIYFSGAITASTIWQTLSGSTTAAPEGTQKLRVTLTWLELSINDVILDNLSILKNSTLSLNTPENLAQVKVFPNPTTDIIQISGLKTIEPYSIYNVMGTEVSKGRISNNDTIDVSKYATGLYVLKFENGHSLKFLKE